MTIAQLRDGINLFFEQKMHAVRGDNPVVVKDDAGRAFEIDQISVELNETVIYLKELQR